MLRLIHAQALWIFALVLLWSGYSFAQGTASSFTGFDLKAWGSSAAIFAALGIVPLVALIKGQFSQLEGWAVLLISLVISEVGAFYLYSARLLTDQAFTTLAPPFVWIAFGLWAFVIASGGWAVIVQLLKKRHAPTVTATATAASPSAPASASVTMASTEVLHDVSGQVVGTTTPLTPPDDRTITGGLK